VSSKNVTPEQNSGEFFQLNYTQRKEIVMSDKLKSITTLIFLMFVISIGDVAGEEADSTKVFRGYFMIGGTAFDIDPLNSRLKTKGYTEFSDEFFSIGGGFFRKASDRVLVGAEGNLLVGEEKSSVIGSNNYSSSAIGGYGFLNTGYLVVENDFLDLYPVIGIGIGGIDFKIGQSSFDDILDNPQGAANLNTFSFLPNFALGADYKIKLPENGTDESFLVLGLRGGYALSLYDRGWFMDEFSLSGDPEGGIGGPYLRITIGGGPISKNRLHGR
jgi:hypothetical protein